VYNIKLNPNKILARLKTLLVAKGYSQVYGVFFSPVAKIAFSPNTYFAGYKSSQPLTLARYQECVPPREGALTLHLCPLF